MKLSEWARRNGVPYKTAWKWFRIGALPDPAIQLKTGTILVRLKEVPNETHVALYARVSSHGQKADLERQQGRLVVWATERGLPVEKVVAEVGSGLNGHRRKLLALLRDPEITAIVVEHRDRLARFGSEYIEAALARSGKRLLVIQEGEANDDLVQDMVDVLTSFCARLYGKRSARSRARKALAAAGPRSRSPGRLGAPSRRRRRPSAPPFGRFSRSTVASRTSSSVGSGIVRGRSGS